MLEKVDLVKSLLAKGHSLSFIAKELGVSSGSLSYFCKKHGISVPSASESRTRTLQSKYGVTNPGQIPSVKDKIRNTNLRKYGVESTVSLPHVRRAAQESIQQNVDDVVEKRRQTSRAKYGADHYMQVAENAARVKAKEIKTKKERGQIVMHNGANAEQLAAELGLSYSYFMKLVRTYCIDYALNHVKHKSNLERQTETLLNNLGLRYISQYHVENRIADFFLPDHNIVIEVDGLYWHSDAVQKDRLYHVKKKQLYHAHNLLPLFFYEDEICEKPDIVASLIAYRCNHNITTIYARKTKPCDVDSSFFDNNHLMGRGQGKIIGLAYNGRVVAAMQVKAGEISRFCCANGVSCIGGFSRLLKLHGNVKSTIIDMRYGDGSYLTKLGFELKSCRPSFYWTNGRVRLNRRRFLGNSGYDAGFFKLWDCGQARYMVVQ